MKLTFISCCALLTSRAEVYLKDFSDSSYRNEVFKGAKTSLRKTSEVVDWDTETPDMWTDRQRNMSNVANLPFQNTINEEKKFFNVLKKTRYLSFRLT